MMKRKVMFALLVFGLLGIATATAQDVQGSQSVASADEGRSPVSIEQVDRSNIEHNEAVKKFGLDWLFKQSYSTSGIFSNLGALQGNRAAVTLYGSNNDARIVQEGSGNVGFIQMGSPSNYVQGNVAEVNQTGNQLLSLINMQGNNNYLLFNQSGYRRGALFNFKGNNLQYKAEQSSAGFQLTPRGGSSPAIKIESTRRVVPVIISN